MKCKIILKQCIEILLWTIVSIVFFSFVANHRSNACEYQMDEEEEILIQKIAVAEAENQGIGGMCFVMQTVLNRVMSEDFPNTVKEVIEQKGQFSSYKSGRYDKCEPTKNSKEALDLLSELKNRGQLYFETVDCDNAWQSKNRKYLFTHLDHKFYK